MKKYSVLLLALLWSINVLAEKHALIIAIGNYPARTGWPAISSLNDVPLIKNALEAQNFKNQNILVITDNAATRKGIFNAFKQLMKSVKPGDIVVIHYSGHGQQIFDDNGDEVDGKDETIVPYDALVRYTSNYKGENHIRDDELGKVISDFRNKLGASGQLLLLLDSCHSGTASRGGKARGGKPALLPPNWTSQPIERTENFNISEEIIVENEASPFVIISGASADELNYEADGVGSLSYAFSRAMSLLGTNDTYRILFSSIASTINTISPRQTPTIEGDIDYVLFKGDYIEQQPYYELLKIARPDIVKLKGGKLNNLFKGTLVSIAPSGTTAISKDDIITSGTIINATYNEATIKLKQPLTNTNHKDYWIFIEEPAYEDLSIAIYCDESLKNPSLKSRISSYLEANKLGKFVKDSLEADIYISEFQGNISVAAKNGKTPLFDYDLTNDHARLEDLDSAIFNYAQGSYLKNLSLKNNNYEFSFRLFSTTEHHQDETEAISNIPNAENNRGILEVNTTTDTLFLEVTNKSKRYIYFNIIEINTKGEIASFMPNDGNDCPYTADDLKIPPGETKKFIKCKFSFVPPYETLTLKGFASDKPLHLQPTIQTRGKSSANTSTTSPLERFISSTYVETRGSSGSSVNGRIDAYSTEFVYKIVEQTSRD